MFGVSVKPGFLEDRPPVEEDNFDKMIDTIVAATVVEDPKEAVPRVCEKCYDSLKKMLKLLGQKQSIIKDFARLNEMVERCPLTQSPQCVVISWMHLLRQVRIHQIVQGFLDQYRTIKAMVNSGWMSIPVSSATALVHATIAPMVGKRTARLALKKLSGLIRKVKDLVRAGKKSLQEEEEAREIYDRLPIRKWVKFREALKAKAKGN